MECPTKQMSSYQRLKFDFDQLHKHLIQEKTKSQIFEHALWEIANLKGPELVQAHNIAIQALFKTNETD